MAQGTSIDIGSTDHAGETINPAAINTEQLSGAQIVTPDGNNDAQKVIDAINGRSNGEPVVIIDPGIPLDWEQQVNLPAESGFSLGTIGKPVLRIPVGFTGSFALTTPETIAEMESFDIGSLTINDSANKVLTAGIQFNDLKESEIAPIRVTGAPGIQLRAVNRTVADLDLRKVDVITNRGPAVETIHSGDVVNANKIHSVHFDDGGAFSTTAIIDRGARNIWNNVHIEQGMTGLLADGATGYKFDLGYVEEPGNWTYMVEERNGGFGIIDIAGSSIQTAQNRLVSEQSVIRGATDGQADRSGGPVDLFQRLAMSTAADSLGNLGFVNASTGGSITVFPNATNLVSLASGSSAGNYAEINTNGDSFIPQHRAPKLFLPVTVGETTQVITRFGWYDNADNFAELVFDPTGSLTDASGAALPSTTNWVAWLQNGSAGGTDRMLVDTGVPPSGTQLLGVQRESVGTTSDWSFVIDGTVVASGGNGGVDIAGGGVRARVETTEAVTKTWNIPAEVQKRLWIN